MSRKQWEFLQDVAKLISWVAEQPGMYVTGGELHRLPETQALLVQRGSSKTTDGQHQKRLAIDLMLFIDGEWQQDTAAYKPLGEYWESLHPDNRWGGNFSGAWDGNHFERRG